MDLLSEFVTLRTYARFLWDDGRRETYTETVDRYINWAFTNPLIPAKVRIKTREKMIKRDVFGSMRALWTAGLAADIDNTVIYNCAFLCVDNLAAFGEALINLMCGCGQGFSVEREYISKLPVVKQQRNLPVRHKTVEDSRKGWKDALDTGILSWYDGRDCYFDFSNIRPMGAPLMTMGGRSSGSEVLRELLRFTRDTILGAQGRQLTSLECHDIMCEIARVVIVGGTRRSALISLSDLDDDYIRDCKDYRRLDYITDVEAKSREMIKLARRSGSNNSAVYYNRPDIFTFLDEWSALGRSGTGERGIANIGGARKNAPHRRKSKLIKGLNPCFRGDMKLLTSKGYKRFVELTGKKVDIINKDGDISTGFVWENPNLQEICEVRFEDDSSIYVTDEHIFMLEDGSKCRALGLKYKYVKQFEGVSKRVVGVFGSKTQERVYDFSEPLTNWGVVNGCVVHNCGEVALRDKEFCNLSECVLRPEDDFESLRDKLTTAAWLSVIQSTHTKFPNLSSEWKANCEDERLCGVSISGQFDNLSLLTPEVLKLLKNHVVNTCKKAAQTLGINTPAAVTSCKPSGTLSVVASCSAGIHPRWDKYYLRSIQIATNDPLFRLMVDQGVPYIIPKGNGDSTAVLQFPVASPKGAITRNDITAKDQLDHYKNVSVNYTEHSASCTVYVAENEWLSVANWVYDNWDTINGLTFYPKEDEKNGYEWVPFKGITEQEYDELANKFPPVDFTRLPDYENTDNTIGAKEIACGGGACEVL